MNPANLPVKASKSELRKAMLRMRMELHRQELRHEALVLMQPLRNAQNVGQYLGTSNAPLWIAGGAVLMTTFLGKNSNWRRWLRIALVAFPLLRRRPPRPSHPTMSPVPTTENGNDLAS